MSVVVPPLTTPNQSNAGTATDKEAWIKFWRSGIEYIAEGVAAYHTARRSSRASSIHSNRDGPSAAASAAALAAQASAHNEVLESCVHALVDTYPVDAIRQSPNTQPSLIDTRIAALEDQVKSLIATVEPLGTRVETLDEYLSRLKSTVQSNRDRTNNMATRVDKLQKEVEALPAAVDITIAREREKENWNSRVNTLEATTRATRDKLTEIGARIVQVEQLRPKVEEQSTKMTMAEGKIDELRHNAGVTHTKMGSLLALAPEAKALLSAPGQLRQTTEDIANLKKEYQLIRGHFNSVKAKLEAAERKLADSDSENLRLYSSLATDVTALQPLKQHVNSLAALPNSFGRLQEGVAEILPLKAHVKDLTPVATRATQLLGLVSHNERINDDITTLRGKINRLREEMTEAKKETFDDISRLSGEVTNLSSANQSLQDDINKVKCNIVQVEDSAAAAHRESQSVSGRVSGIDAKLKASQVTAEWSQEQLRTIQIQIAHLEPLGEQREALLLLAGQTEAIMPLAPQVKSLSSAFGTLSCAATSKGSETKDEVLAKQQKLCSILSLDSEEAKQRLGQLEANVTQLESDASNALERLAELQSASSATTVRTKQDQQTLQKFQNQITPLVPLIEHTEALKSVAHHHKSLVSLIQEFNKLKDRYEIDVMSSISDVNTFKLMFRTRTDEMKKQIASLESQYHELQTCTENVGKLERRVSKVETENIRLRTKIRTSSGVVERASSDEANSQTKLPETPELAGSKQLADPLRPLRTRVPNLEKLAGKADDLLSLVDETARMKEEISQLDRKFKKDKKRIDDLGDTVHSLDELMTTTSTATNGHQVRIDLLEREFQDLKDSNATKIKGVEASISQLSLLKEHSAALFALVRKTARPVSSTQQPSKSIEERVIELERSDQSATKEITNIVAWLKRMDTNQPQGGALKALETRVKELSDSSNKTLTPLTPLVERVPALLALLERTSSRTTSPKPNDRPSVPPANQPETLTQAVGRVNVLEETVKGLSSFKAKAKEDLERLSTQLETLMPADNVFQSFVDRTQLLSSLMPLAEHVPKIITLVDQVPQLQTSMKSLSERVEACTISSPVDLGPAGRLRPLVTDRHASQPTSPTSNSGTTPVLLFPGAEGAPAPQIRQNKKRRIEALIESLEERIDGVSAEVDGVVEDVRHLYSEKSKTKRQRVGERQSQAGRPLDTGESSLDLPTIARDLDKVMDAIMGLWGGKGGWPEQLDLLLGQWWAQVLELPAAKGDLRGARSIMQTLFSEIEVLKLAIEARGSGISATGSPAVDASHIAWMGRFADELKTKLNEDQAAFRTQLEELLSKSLKPIKNMYKALKQDEEQLE